jgi:hypothetical protein
MGANTIEFCNVLRMQWHGSTHAIAFLCRLIFLFICRNGLGTAIGIIEHWLCLLGDGSGHLLRCDLRSCTWERIPQTGQQPDRRWRSRNDAECYPHLVEYGQHLLAFGYAPHVRQPPSPSNWSPPSRPPANPNLCHAAARAVPAINHCLLRTRTLIQTRLL